MATAEIAASASTSSGTKTARRLAWLGLLLLLLTALAFVFIPAWIIQPFKAQTQSGMHLSFVLRRWSPIVAPLCLISMVVMTVWLWRGAKRWWRKTGLVVMLLFAGVFTWFSRQNHFEWMFNPLPNPGYTTIAENSLIQDGDMVLAVENNGDAVAYPVRLMAYHHVVQDVVGGTPIVATY